MDKGFRLRLIRQDDVNSIKELVDRTIDTSYIDIYPPKAMQFVKDLHSPENISSDIANGYYIGAELGGKIIGSGALVNGRIRRLFVAPEHQKMGIGRLIMEQLELQAEELGLKKLELVASLPAKKLYDSLGYITCTEKLDDIGDDVKLHSYEMEKILLPDEVVQTTICADSVAFPDETIMTHNQKQLKLPKRLLKRTLIGFIIAAILVTSLFTWIPWVKNKLTFYPVGNSICNLFNYGLIAAKGDWVYFSDYTSQLSIWKMKVDGSNKQKLVDGRAFFLNVLGDWIYYLDQNGKSSQITKIRTDGSDKSTIYEGQIKNLFVSGGWIYFSEYSSTSDLLVVNDRCSLNKIKTDGSKMTVLINKNVTSFTVFKDWIYYSRLEGVAEFRKMKTDGTKDTLITNSLFKILSINDEWIYYTVNQSDTDISSINRMHHDGSSNEQFFYKKGASAIFDGNQIYYTLNNGILDKSIFSLNNKEPKKLCDIEGVAAICLNISGDWIYYLEIYYPEVDSYVRFRFIRTHTINGGREVVFDNQVISQD